MVTGVQQSPTTSRPVMVRQVSRHRRGPARSLRWLRLAQIRATSACMQRLTSLNPVASLVARVRKWPLARQVVDLVAGYNRVLPDLATARQVAEWYGRPGADSAEDAGSLQASMSRTRPSDYPVLFHLSRLPLEGL